LDNNKAGGDVTPSAVFTACRIYDARERVVHRLIAILSPAVFAFGFVAAFPASAQTVQERLPVCLACHGESGQSQTPDVPSLGGQQAFYVAVQLMMFREKMRTAEPMNQVTKGLSDDDLQSFAGIISKLPPPKPPEGPPDQARMARAQALVQQNRCNFCHTPTFAGQDNVPRIADQREDYIVKSLRGYKDNSRHGYDGSMADVVAPLTDDQILDLADYIARVK
jgi:cytochrome c553